MLCIQTNAICKIVLLLFSDVSVVDVQSWKQDVDNTQTTKIGTKYPQGIN